MKRFTKLPIFLSIFILGCLGAVVVINVPLEKPSDLESATGLSTEELVEVAVGECSRYEQLLGSS